MEDALTASAAAPVLREGTAADERAVGELCESIYPGTDHVPWYWTRFVRDPGTQPWVIEIGGVITALAVLDVREGAGWVHSARVAPAFRGGGLFTRLLRRHTEESRRRALSHLRFATHPGNEAMHRVAEREGFRLHATYRYVSSCAPTGEGDAAAPGDVRQLEPADLDALEAFLRSTGGWTSGNDLCCAAWTWRDVTPDLLRSMLARGTAYGFEAGRGLEGAALTCQDLEDDYRWFFLSWIGGTERSIGFLGRRLRREVATAKPDGDEESPLCGMVFDDPAALAGLAQAGFHFDPDEDMDVLELAL